MEKREITLSEKDLNLISSFVSEALETQYPAGILVSAYYEQEYGKIITNVDVALKNDILYFSQFGIRDENIDAFNNVFSKYRQIEGDNILFFLTKYDDYTPKYKENTEDLLTRALVGSDIIYDKLGKLREIQSDAGPDIRRYSNTCDIVNSSEINKRLVLSNKNN